MTQNKFVKRSGAALLCAVLIPMTTGLLTPKKAHAAIGGAMSLAGGSGVPVMVIGGITFAAGAGVVALANIPAAPADIDPDFPWAAIFEDFANGVGMVLGDLVGGTVAVVGLVVLDDHGGQATLGFGPLSEPSARSLAVTGPELEAYDQELDELNAVREEVAVKLGALPSPRFSDAHALWQELRPSLSPETFSIAGKISARLVQRISHPQQNRSSRE